MVSAELKAKHPEIPWQEIHAMRNIVAHEYMNVDYNEVWQAITKDFEELRQQVEPIISELSAAEK